MPLVFGPDGTRLPDLMLTDAKRQEIQQKIADALVGVEMRVNPWIYVTFDDGSGHCEVYLKRDASEDGFSETSIAVGVSDFDALVRA